MQWSKKPGGEQAIKDAKRRTRSLSDDYLERLPLDSPEPSTMFLSSDLDDEDEDWRATIGGDSGTSTKHSGTTSVNVSNLLDDAPRW